MLRIDDVIFSMDIIEKKFKCDLTSCNGNCCRYGDSGAPLAPEEVEILEKIWPAVKPYLRQEGISAIEKQGTSIIDHDNERVTPLVNNEECAYTIINNGIYMCGIEKAWSYRKTKFQKPLSCHLFPAKIKNFSGFRAVNYQELPICRSALENGKKKGLYLYKFLKIPLIRALGEKLYEQLCIAARELKKK
ncbi:MAG TPA: DUF3109 family protein [Bacteroidales bacterium]|jgi:hypothetical protein|nr:DUF3109 family protein [Bacteroidales bacterium]NMD01781.1 DUF3109 family protein [Bacteroidales bacterium]HOU01794.1 DUF3109 family protein [Bacteroidales bacterium]HQG62316.1 DUF3109 family protein [Bacteroidales bacterium]HQK68201.1 DUF3109 family protein [Bacteroidales bacterium]